MRKYLDSDIFIRMNTGNAIVNQLTIALKNINNTSIVNTKITESLNNMVRAYRETMAYKVTEAVKNFEIVLIAPMIDKRFPANIPFVRSKRNGKECIIVDISRYTSVDRDENNNITDAKCDVSKLFNILIPAYIALTVLNPETVISSDAIRWMAVLWAKMFNKVLMSQKIFTNSQEKYEAFMYFAMKFFMLYYVECPDIVADKIAIEYIGGTKSKYISFVESNLAEKGINIYEDWNTFAVTMFSDEITNIKLTMNGSDINAEIYLKLFASYMGRDGAYMALWSVDYFFYCLFVTYNKAYILNDRNWEDIVYKDKKIMPKIMNALYKEI